MRHKFYAVFHIVTVMMTLLALQGVLEAAQRPWNVKAEIERLNQEVPSLPAFNDPEGVVWMNELNYDLLADGTMRRRARFLMMLSDTNVSPQTETHVLPYPEAEGAAVDIREANWYDPVTGEKGGALPVERYDRDGIKCEVVRFPSVARGKVVAIESISTNPMRYYLDEVVPLSGTLPIWEQSVSVLVPSGMDVYWEAVGLRSPERKKELGTERVTWTLHNQPAWEEVGVVEEKHPMLLFSLQRGFIGHLKSFFIAESSIKAPPIPASLTASKGQFLKFGANLTRYLKEKEIDVFGYQPRFVRNNQYIDSDSNWTRWEQTLIAGKWFASLGYDVQVFWTQKLPVTQNGPAALPLWDEPVLKIAQEGAKEDVFFKAGQLVDFGKVDPSLYGETAYRWNGNDIMRLVLPKGNASEHTLAQAWRLTMEESGAASGTLDLTVTGGWVDVMGLGRLPEGQHLPEAFMDRINFTLPGLAMETKAIKQLGHGYRITFDVNASLGIVSGSDILMRFPGGLPESFEKIPGVDENYHFRFPFVLEQSALITTPKGYRAIMMPEKLHNGDSKALLEEKVDHWIKRRHADISSKWTVRTTAIDELLTRRIREQLMIAERWGITNLPLRK